MVPNVLKIFLGKEKSKGRKKRGGLDASWSNRQENR